MASLIQRYREAVEGWLPWARRFIYTPSQRPELACYGTGYNNWGVQTNQKAFAALAVAATDPELDEERAGASRDDLIEEAMRLLRFSLESHLVGSFHCTDGTQWGHTWISSLGVERMMHGVEAVMPYLSANEGDLLREMLISESDWLLDNYEIVADPDATTGRNKPESNLWNGAVMHRTSMMYPDAPRADEYREKGSRFLINSISVPSDATMEKVVDGRPVSEWFVGPQFFETYALHHHCYLNVGYMVICLSNAAMLHLGYRTWNQEPPEALRHHVEDLWRLVRHFVFPDGRLLRIGGDTRVRYCYCQDYLVPTLLMAEDLWKDQYGPKLEEGWLGLVEHERAQNGDGSYLSRRCAQLGTVSPLYFTRLESDRACTLSMGAWWRRKLKLPEVEPKAPAPTVSTFAWHDDFHGAAFHKSPRRVASWVWWSAERPQGLCAPADASDMVEWRQNLAGEIKGQGRVNEQGPREHHEVVFDGGFLTWGRTLISSKGMVAEGQSEDADVVEQHLAFAALPDDATVVALQYARTMDRRVYLSRIKGIHLLIPNDLFNGNQRTVWSAGGEIKLKALPGTEEKVDLQASWLNVDDRLGVVLIYGDSPLCIYRPPVRQIGLKGKPWRDPEGPGGMLYCEEICAPCSLRMRPIRPRTVLYDVGFILHTNLTHEETVTYGGQGSLERLSTSQDYVRAVRLRGLDGQDYFLLLNLADAPVDVLLTGIGVPELVDLGSGESIEVVEPWTTCLVEAHGARLLTGKG